MINEDAPNYGVVKGQRDIKHLGLPGRLRAARKRAAVSVHALAERAGLHFSVIQTVEDRGLPRLDTIETIARALKISPCVLAYNVEADFIDESVLQCAAVGKRLLQVREAQGLSRNALGKLAGISHTAVGNIEDKGHMPTVAMAEKIARALKIDVCWLAFGQSEAPNLPPPVAT